VNTFAKLFVIVNRVFGFFTVVGGICVLALSAYWLFHYGLVKAVWKLAAVGVAFIFIGILYLKAPLFRSSSSHDEE
jgi:hypothetical protein